MKWKVNVWRLEIWRDASCKSLSITLTMLYVLTRRIMGILKHWHSELIFLPQICLLLAVLSFLCVGVAPFREVMSSVTGKSTNWDICEPAGPEHTQVYPHISSGSHPPSPSLVWEKEQSISNVLSSKSNKPLKAGKLWALLIFIHQTCACFMSGQSVHSYTQILCPICHTWSINPFFSLHICTHNTVNPFYVPVFNHQ